jgi:3-dehydroquinate synthase
MKNPFPHPVFSGDTVWDDFNQFLATRLQRGGTTFICCDDNTYEHCLPEFLSNCRELAENEVIVIAPGEVNKTVELLHQLWYALSEKGADRSSLIINLGGGIVTDVGGFLASTYMRGIDFVNIPTSLLGMVDAAIGGKTGINLNAGKNGVGTFSWPIALVIAPEFLETLPSEEFLSGTAEMLKHGWVLDANHFEGVRLLLGGMDSHLGDLIGQSIRIKAHVVQSDFTEQGNRVLLNAGHTLGHALESFAMVEGHKNITHGFAVAAGLVAEAWIARAYYNLSKLDFDKLTEAVLPHYPPVVFEKHDITKILNWMNVDKKRKQGKWAVPLPMRVGKAEIITIEDPKIFRSALMAYKTLIKSWI